MEPFAELLERLESSDRPEVKRAALVAYFAEVKPADAAIALNYFLGRSLGFSLSPEQFRVWAEQVTGFPGWLMQEGYDVVGDWGETLSLTLESPSQSRRFGLEEFILQQLSPLGDENAVEQGVRIKALWRVMAHKERVAMYRLLTKRRSGRELRTLTTEALAEIHGLSESVIRYRLRNFDKPSSESFLGLVASRSDRDKVAELYPLQSATQRDVESLEENDFRNLEVEWQWDGIRAQLICRQEQITVWSRAGELLNDWVPELVGEASLLPSGTVLDGMLLLWEGETPRPRTELEKCLGAKPRRSSRTSVPKLVLLVFDLLELGEEDIRERSLNERRLLLRDLLGDLKQEGRNNTQANDVEQQELLPLGLSLATDVLPVEQEDDGLIRISPSLEVKSIQALGELLSQARGHRCRGILLKDKTSPYTEFQTKNSWVRLGVPPLRFRVVLLSVQEQSESRKDEFSGWTFGVSDEKGWVTVAMVNARLDLVELPSLHERIRSLIVARRGPVRLLEPALVFELSCESVEVSSRHRSGLTLAAAKVDRWLSQVEPSSTHSLEALRNEVV